MAIKKTVTKAKAVSVQHDPCAKCDAKIAALEKNVKNLEKTVQELQLQLKNSSVKDPRVDRLISVLRNCVPKFNKKW